MAITQNYINSVEVASSGSRFNSNPLKLLKNSTYEFSINWSNVKPVVGTTYSLSIYLVSTSATGLVTKSLIGKLNPAITTTYSGTYKNKFSFSTTVFGTVMIVPKNLISIAISGISIKPYVDKSYAPDSLIIKVPYRPSVPTEKVSLRTEFIDELGNQCCEPLNATAIVDPAGWTRTFFFSSGGGGAPPGGDIVYDGGEV